MPQTQPRSPRLLVLRRHLRAGDRAALDTFWQEVREQGTPLIEPIAGDDRHRLVTFLWRGNEAVRNVVVLTWAFSVVPAENRLRHLADTDVWYKTYRLPADLRMSYRLSVNDPQASARQLTPAQAATRTSVGQADPLNPHRLGEASVAALPAAPSQPYVEMRAEVPRGQVHERTLHSDLLSNDRPIWVYTPPAYTTDGPPYGVVVLLDGQAYVSAVVPTPTILDNLIAEGAIPPLVAALVSSIDVQTRLRELACHAPFSDFLVNELLPWVRQRFHVATTPAQTMLAGASLGGLAAAFTALRHAAVFGSVLSQSGAFWWSNEDPEWLTRQVVHQEPVPVRFYLEAGRLEYHRTPLLSGPETISLLHANRHLRDVLQAKGYDVHYSESSGGHDAAWSRGTLADGLQLLAGNAAAGGHVPAGHAREPHVKEVSASS